MTNRFYDCKRAFSQSYLLGRIVRNAQRPTRRSVSFSLEGEGQDEEAIFRVIHYRPHPNPLPQVGEGIDSMLALSDSASF